MAGSPDSALILLSYKNKILLMLKDKPAILSNLWRFIKVEKDEEKSFEESLFNKVKYEMGVRIESIEFLSKARFDDSTLHFFHARLTDFDVNTISRSEGQDINFYSVKEVRDLRMTTSTKLFINKHQQLVDTIGGRLSYSG